MFIRAVDGTLSGTFFERILAVLIDIFFFGLPLMGAICFAAHAVREQDERFWPPALSILAYCAFYLAGGREVIFYLGGTLVGCAMFL
jgi:hypothetical protein